MTNIDYRTTFFEFPQLTKIHGEPDYDTLHRLHNELKSNAGSVPSTLGGGAHGHLGLILDAQRYATVSNIPYIRPNFPGPLLIPPGITPQIAMLYRDHRQETVRTFREVVGVEQTLRKQIVATIDADYLSTLRDRNKNSITIPIYQIIQYLFTNHGKISPTQLQDRESKITQLIYDPTLPLDSIFKPIEDLMDYATAAGIPYSNTQVITFAYVLILKTGKFGTYITDWNRRPTNNKTWANFKLFFRNAHKELRETTDLTVQETHFHANLIQDIVQGLKEELSQVSTQQHDPVQLSNIYANQASETSPQNTMGDVESLHGEINSLKTIIQNMQNQMLQRPPTPLPVPMLIPQQQGTAFYATSPSYTPPSVTSTDASTLTPNTQAARTQKQLFYCWTHGFSTNEKHTSPTCNFKAQEHKKNATAENMMGGCKRGINRYLAMKKK